MTKEDLKNVMDRVIQEIQSLCEAGQKEYAGGENAFGNFERIASRIDTSREKVLWTYLTKHLDGIESHIKGHISQREPVEGRINDAIVYLIILRGMVEDSKPKPT